MTGEQAWVSVVLLVVVYLIPTFVATSRKHRNAGVALASSTPQD